MRTVLILGDQLNRSIGALAQSEPSKDRILMIESAAVLERPFHRQRLHMVVTAMRRLAVELRDDGFEVDYRKAATFRTGIDEHVKAHDPEALVTTEPNSRAMRSLLAKAGAEFVRTDQFLTHPEEFADWAAERDRLRMEDFYRWQRSRLGYLMEGDGSPSGGQWNFDADNREPPPDDGEWVPPVVDTLDDIDRRVLDEIGGVGDDPYGWWPTSRAAAVERLDHFVEHVLPGFGPHEDAMTLKSWHLAHSLLSPALNLGLLLPAEVCDAVENAYRQGLVPINSAEGFIRQVIGWREFVWGIYWLWPDQVGMNIFDHRRPIPPAWDGGATAMVCVSQAVEGLRERAWIHHIERLMVLSNFANLYGIDPDAVHDWMRAQYIDGGNWVMGPNVYGMGLWADGGRMSTKPYVSGGAYINRMSDYCGGCQFNPRNRVGEDACPFTTLYWDFLDRHRDKLEPNHRMARQYGTLDRLKDFDEVRQRARQVKQLIEDGKL